MTIGNLYSALIFLFMALALPFSCAAADGSDSPASVEEDQFFDEFDDLEDEFATNSVEEVFDPLAPCNRAVCVFNDKLYFWALKPVARGYKWVVPKEGRLSVRRFFTNLGYPRRFVGNVLQFKFKNAGVETARFGVNSTIGILGLFDPASSWLDLDSPPKEDCGQVLGKCGVGEGFPLMLPLLGPSNLRDIAGKIADGFLNPLAYVDPTWIYYGSRSVRIVNDTSLRIGQYEAMKEQALDHYTFLRDAYGQYREKQISE